MPFAFLVRQIQGSFYAFVHARGHIKIFMYDLEGNFVKKNLNRGDY